MQFSKDYKLIPAVESNPLVAAGLEDVLSQWSDGCCRVD
jgi:hypothetical protein